MNFVYTLLFLIPAFSIHEFAHAWAAYRLGDPTPKISGRVTLNPLAHVDPLGLLALLVVKVGWGKPVPVNPNNFKNPKRDHLLVAFAGPFANLALALLTVSFADNNNIFLVFSVLNFNLAVFNLLPVFPLDGYSVVAGLLPRNLYSWWESLKQYGFYILLASFLPVLPGANSVVTLIVDKALDLFFKFANI